MQKISLAEAKQHVLIRQAQEDKIFPVRLIIPKIHVDATIEYVGMTTMGAMAVPSNAMNVGWFEFGPVPGEKGSAVIAGHLDEENGKKGVFTHLDKLKSGDEFVIENNKGKSMTFIVQESRTYDPGYADEVFGRSDAAYLNLITCEGSWNKKAQNYSKRLVVFASLTN